MKQQRNVKIFLALFSLTAGIGAAQAEVIDDFNYASFSMDQSYWTRIASSTPSYAFTTPSPNYGTAVLRAQSDSNARSALVSPLASEFNFFSTGYTVGLSGFQLLNANLANNQTYFRLALSSTAQRQFDANDAVTLRLDLAGNVLFGYKLNQSSVDAEGKSGAAAGSLQSFNYGGTVNAISLSLAPGAENAGVTTVEYTIALDGSLGLQTVSGSFDAAEADWGANGDSALMLESRRQNSTADSTSYARANIDTVTYNVMAVPEPSTYAVLGLGILAWGVRGRRKPKMIRA